MPDLLRTLLAPVLLVQGKRMFARMPRLDAPADLAPGPRGDGSPIHLLVVGDSSAAGYGADRQEDALLGQLVARLAASHTVTWTHFARFGSTVPKTAAFVAKQPPVDVDLAVVSVGLNDVIAGADLGLWLDGYRALVADLQTRFAATTVVVSGLAPVGGFPALPQPMRFVIARQRRTEGLGGRGARRRVRLHRRVRRRTAPRGRGHRRRGHGARRLPPRPTSLRRVGAACRRGVGSGRRFTRVSVLPASARRTPSPGRARRGT